MTHKKNPYIDPPDYWKELNESAQKLKNRPELVEFEKICYELFVLNQSGVKFIEIITERYLVPALPSNVHDYATSCVWAEGFKEAFRMLIRNITTHTQRINAELNQ